MLLIKLLFIIVLSIVAVLVMAIDVRKQANEGLSKKYQEKYFSKFSSWF